MGSSTEYYERRLDQARTLAERADDPAIKRAHLGMAKRYRGIVERGEPPEPRELHQVVVNQLDA